MPRRPSGRKVGRPPDPPELRLLKYGAGATEAPADTAKPNEIPAAPATLRAAGRQAWVRYWKFGKAWLAETDYETIVALCRLHDDDARLRRLLDREGWTVRGDDPMVLQAKATHELLIKSFDGDEVKANLVLYQLREIAKQVGDVKSHAHPLWRMLLDVRSRLLPLWIDAHMTPSSRGKARVKVPEADPLEAWQAQ